MSDVIAFSKPRGLICKAVLGHGGGKLFRESSEGLFSVLETCRKCQHNVYAQNIAPFHFSCFSEKVVDTNG